MAIKGLLTFILGVAFLVGLALYADRHRAEDKKKPNETGESL